MARLYEYFLLSLSVAAFAATLNTNDQVNANIDYGTFQNPSVDVRPKFRYWIPDASVDLKVVRDDFAAIASKGAGGFELLGYYL